MKRITILSILFVGAVALIAAGCGGSEPELPKTPPAPSTPAAPASTPAPAPAPVASTAPAAPSAPAAAGKVSYVLSPDTTIIWAASVPIGTRKGGWVDFAGSIEVDGGNYETATVTAEVKMASVFSDAAEITQKMQGDDHFFQPGKYPISKFTSTSIKKTETGYDLTGDLTIRDTTKSITFPVTDLKVEGKTLTCKSTIKLNRHDFGIEYSSAIGDYAINDICELSLEVVAEAK